MKTRNKILYLIHTPPPVHGVSKICLQIYNSNTVNFGLNKRIIRLNLSTNIHELRKINIFQFFRFIGLYIKLLGTLIFFRPNMVYFSIMPVGLGFWKDSMLALSIKIFRVKILYHLHNRGIPRYYIKPAYRFAYNLVFRNTDIIHLSENLRKSELLPYFSKSACTHVCHNSVPDILHSKTEITNSTLNILFFSNLFVHKGLKTLLNTIEILHNRKINFKLIIAGAPTHNSQKLLHDFSLSNTHLRNHIEIHGATYENKKKELFNKADIFVFPSEFKEECMPLVILEALSAGLPVIASNIGAISSTVINNSNGFLIHKRDAGALADKIEHLASDKELRMKMGKQSRKLYLENFVVEKQEEKIREFFLKYLIPNS